MLCVLTAIQAQSCSCGKSQKGSTSGQSYTPPTYSSTLCEQWAEPTLTYDAVPVSLAPSTGFVFCSWGQLAQPGLDQYSKVTLTQKRNSTQSAPGTVFLVQAHTCPHSLVLQSTQLKVGSLGFEHPGGCVRPWAGSLALFDHTVSVWRDLAAELVVSWACAQKGCSGNDGWISSLEISSCWLNLYSSLPLPQPHLLIKLDSLEVKIFVHICIYVLLSKNFRICCWIQLHLARVLHGLEVLNCWMHGGKKSGENVDSQWILPPREGRKSWLLMIEAVMR